MTVGAWPDRENRSSAAPPGSAVEDESAYQGRRAPDTGGGGSNPPQNGSIAAQMPEPVPPAAVKEIRKRLDLNQRDFARLLAVSPGTVGSWETGKRIPSALHWRLLGTISLCISGAKSNDDWRQHLKRGGYAASMQAFLLLVTGRGVT